MTGRNGKVKLTSSQEASLANPSPLQERGKGQAMNATCGQQCLEQFVTSGPSGWSVKMFAGLLVGMRAWSSSRCMLTWKLKVTKSKRSFFLLQVSVPRTEGNGYSLLPTPLVKAGGRALNKDGKNLDRNGMRYGRTLPQLLTAGLLPTPQAIDGSGSGRELRLKTGKRDPTCPGSWRGDLKDFAYMGLLPTPRANQVNGANLEGNQKLAARKKGNLEEVIARMLLPTPTTRDYKGSASLESIMGRQRNHLTNNLPDVFAKHGKTSQLSPRFVAEMMGFPVIWTELPFLVGATRASSVMAMP